MYPLGKNIFDRFSRVKDGRDAIVGEYIRCDLLKDMIGCKETK